MYAQLTHFYIEVKLESYAKALTVVAASGRRWAWCLWTCNTSLLFVVKRTGCFDFYVVDLSQQDLDTHLLQRDDDPVEQEDWTLVEQKCAYVAPQVSMEEYEAASDAGDWKIRRLAKSGFDDEESSRFYVCTQYV